MDECAVNDILYMVERMDKIILFGASFCGNKYLSFLEYQKRGDIVFALCDNDTEKIGKKLKEKNNLNMVVMNTSTFYNYLL